MSNNKTDYQQNKAYTSAKQNNQKKRKIKKKSLKKKLIKKAIYLTMFTNMLIGTYHVGKTLIDITGDAINKQIMIYQGKEIILEDANLKIDISNYSISNMSNGFIVYKQIPNGDYGYTYEQVPYEEVIEEIKYQGENNNVSKLGQKYVIEEYFSSNLANRKIPIDKKEEEQEAINAYLNENTQVKGMSK